MCRRIRDHQSLPPISYLHILHWFSFLPAWLRKRQRVLDGRQTQHTLRSRSKPYRLPAQGPASYLWEAHDTARVPGDFTRCCSCSCGFTESQRCTRNTSKMQPICIWSDGSQHRAISRLSWCWGLLAANCMPSLSIEQPEPVELRKKCPWTLLVMWSREVDSLVLPPGLYKGNLIQLMSLLVMLLPLFHLKK